VEPAVLKSSAIGSGLFYRGAVPAAIRIAGAAVALLLVAAIVVFFTLLPVGVMALAWSYYAWRYRHLFPTPHELPEVAVILPLRGADPLLESCLAGVLAQDNPAYQEHITIA
jgi:hypothetical protein